MPGVDDYGQGIPWLDNSDAPDLKIATKGIVDALVPRSVMRYTNAAARNAAIMTPEPGMQAFLTSERELTQYDGGAWVVVAAGTSTWTTVTLASGFTHNGNGNGNLQYRVVNEFGELYMKFRGAINASYSGSSVANGGVITSSPLPVLARPTTLRTIVIPCSDVNSERITLKLDGLTDGHLKVFGTQAGSTPPWIGFNNCGYSL